MKKLYLLIIISSLVLIGCTKKVESVTISPEEIELNADNHETYQLKAVVDPKSATKQLTWTSSNEFVATVNDNGIVQSKDIGECTITAQAGDKSAICRVMVYDATTTLQSIEFADKNLTVNVGQTKKLDYSLKPSFLNPKLTWTSSDNSIVKVSETGTITAVAEGTATITASYKDIKGVCNITVNSTTVSLNKTKDTLAVEDKMQLTATTTPSVSSSFIKWTSSNTGVAKVDSTGKVTAIAKGDVVIKATIGKKEATCNIHVASAIISLPSSVYIYECRTYKLPYTIRPASAENAVVWTSSSDSIIAGKNGNVTLKHNPGKGVVTATYKEVTAKCTVSISSTSINISPNTVSMLKNTSKKLSYTTSPAGDSSLVTWSSSNTSVATVSSKGVVTTGNVTSGTAVITAKLHDKRTATCNVNIVSAIVTLNKTSIGPMLTGTKDTIKATTNPSSYVNSVTWSSSNTSVATVSNGIVTAVAAGTAVITASVGNSTAQCTITVDSRKLWIFDGSKIYRNDELYLTPSSSAERMIRYNGYCYTIRRENVISYYSQLALYRNNNLMDTIGPRGISGTLNIGDIYLYSGKIYMAVYLNYSDSNACVYRGDLSTNKLSVSYYRMPINPHYYNYGDKIGLIGVSSSGTTYTAWVNQRNKYIKTCYNNCQDVKTYYSNGPSNTITIYLWCKAYNATDGSVYFFAESDGELLCLKNGAAISSYGTLAIHDAAFDNSGNLYAVRSDGSVTKNNTTILPSGTVSYTAKIALYNSDYYIYDAGKVYKNGTLYARFNNCKYSAVDFVVE